MRMCGLFCVRLPYAPEPPTRPLSLFASINETNYSSSAKTMQKMRGEPRFFNDTDDLPWHNDYGLYCRKCGAGCAISPPLICRSWVSEASAILPPANPWNWLLAMPVESDDSNLRGSQAGKGAVIAPQTLQDDQQLAPF